MGWDGMAWHGMVWDGMGWDGMAAPDLPSAQGVSHRTACVAHDAWAACQPAASKTELHKRQSRAKFMH